MQKAEKKLYLSLSLLSLVMTVIAVWIFFARMTPYYFQNVRTEDRMISDNTAIYYHDFNHDGYNERVVLGEGIKGHLYSVKIMNMTNLHVYGQLNLDHKIIYSEISFTDVNNDGNDEILVFSHDNDSLYLSIIDYTSQQFLIRERGVLSSKNVRLRKFWDIFSLPQQVVDLDGDGKKELLFAVNTGYAGLPRCLCVYDLQSFTIRNRFDHHMGAVSFCAIDINNDHKKEIAVGSYASANFPANVSLSDMHSWFLLLNHKLQQVIKPRQIGGEFSTFTVKPVVDKNEKFIAGFGELRDSSWIWIMDKDGKRLNEWGISPKLSTILIDTMTSPTRIIVSNIKNHVFIFDTHLRILKQFTFPYKHRITIRVARKILNANKVQFVAASINTLYLFDDQFNLLARHGVVYGDEIKQVFVNYWPGEKYPHIGLKLNKNYYELQIFKNPFYSKMPIVFLVMFVLFYLLSVVLLLLVNKVRQYISYFIFSLRHSDNAIVMLNRRGKIISVNQKVGQFLRLDRPIKEGMYYNEAFEKRPRLNQIIEQSMKSLKQVQESLDFEDQNASFFGEVTVTPFFSYFDYVNAFLVEIKDSTRQVLLERQQNWQRNVRKMVHDIKTPLGGVQLKLQTLYLRLTSEHPDIRPELYEELEEAYSELRRIRNISKNFLKFSDLEKLNIQKIELEKLMRQSLEPFAMYTNERLCIQYSIDSHLPQYVFWDERQIELLMHIIIENSLDALEGRGKIDITVKPSGRVKAVRDPWIEIRVSDDGPGSPDDIKDKIFEPHFTTKKEGSGLGLAFARHIVQQHGGRIDFFSNKNSGTVFVVFLPSNVTIS